MDCKSNAWKTFGRHSRRSYCSSRRIVETLGVMKRKFLWKTPARAPGTIPRATQKFMTKNLMDESREKFLRIPTKITWGKCRRNSEKNHLMGFWEQKYRRNLASLHTTRRDYLEENLQRTAWNPQISRLQNSLLFEKVLL